jgi:transposase
MTVPGVGPSTSVRFVAALDEISRFSGAHAVESYLGLVPGENSSS